MDQLTILLGTMFWGALYAAGFVGILIGIIVFLFFYGRCVVVGRTYWLLLDFLLTPFFLKATYIFFRNLLAVLIALICTITIKILISVFLLRTAYSAFYRKEVNQVNIVSLALECIMIGFAVGTALVRAVKLVLISALYVGRVDTPLLAPGVGVGPMVDKYPFIFRQDILALEAHRHPYLDLIGKLYLMKLCYGCRFADRAGYCYRLIFAVALMPWLRKYRVMARPELGDDGGDSPDGSIRRATILPRSSILCQSTQMA